MTKERKKVRKSRRFLHIFVSLSVLILTGAAYGAGYTCPESKRYTTCYTNYFMTPNAQVGNSCQDCRNEYSDEVQDCSDPITIPHGTRVSSGKQNCVGKFTEGSGSNGTESQIGTITCSGCSEFDSCQYERYVCNCDTGYHAVNQGTSSCTCEPDCSPSKECSSLGAEWSGTFNECEVGDENTKCTKPCTKHCSQSLANCPEHATCVYDDNTRTGVLKYGNRNDETMCEYEDFPCAIASITCNEGYQYFDSPSRCVKKCTLQCSENDTASCPENAICTYENKIYDGTENEEGACEVPSNLCPVESFTCKPGYKKSDDGHSCILNEVTCGVGEYLPMGTLTCAACTAGSWCPGNQTFEFNAVTDQGITACPSAYPNSEMSATAITQCFSDTKSRPWTGIQNPCTTPDNCATATCNECSVDACDYSVYANADGTADGALKDGCATNDDPCTQTVASVTANVGFFVEDMACPICPDGKICAGGDAQPETCPAGKVCVNGGVSECPAGHYCPSGSSEATECPEGSFCPTGSATPFTCPADADGSETPRDDFSRCYQLCDMTVEDVEFSVSVTPVAERVYALSETEFPTCSYNIECERGYVLIDGDTSAPSCQNVRRSILLNDQNPTTGSGVRNLYIWHGEGWYSDPQLRVEISNLETLPTKTGYDFGGYYSQPKGQGLRIIENNGNLIFSHEVLTFASAQQTEIYADWIPGITTCAAGEYYTNSIGCVPCPADNYCPGGDFRTEGGTQGLNSCADLGDGAWSHASSGSVMPEDCYRTCESREVIYGTAYPVNQTENWPVACSFNGVSDTGNPCDIIDDRCVETSCTKEFELIGGLCTPCSRENAVSYKDGANCFIQGCVDGYHPNAGGVACVENTVECVAPNAVEAYQTWDYKQQAFSACTIKTCNDGYHVTANACVLDEQACVVEHGTGVKEWDFVANAWGPCTATQCDPGYTNDPAQTTDTAQQCGRCRNHFSVLGTPAASSYIRECEIASCMYQGELYILRDNECEPICDINGREDDTGFMKWNPTTGKCDRTCKTGYSMW